MCFTNVNEAWIRCWYFMYSTNKCTDFNKNIILIYKKKKKNTKKKQKKPGGELRFSGRVAVPASLVAPVVLI